MAKAWAKWFYKSDPWRALRDQALRRDGFTCEFCGARAEEVHHEIELTPENIHDPAISLNLELLHSLCHDCHTRITNAQKHGDALAACDAGYYFDDNGVLTPRGPTDDRGHFGTGEGPSL